MKTLKNPLLAAVLAFLPTAAFADVCSDLAGSYFSRIVSLQNDIKLILDQLTDPAEKEALIFSYQMQKDQLVMERDAVLGYQGCSTNFPLPSDPFTPPPPAPEPVPVPEPVPSEELSCKEQLADYFMVLKAQHLHPLVVLKRMHAKTHELGCDDPRPRRHACGHRYQARRIHLCGRSSHKPSFRR